MNNRLGAGIPGCRLLGPRRRRWSSILPGRLRKVTVRPTAGLGERQRWDELMSAHHYASSPKPTVPTPDAPTKLPCDGSSCPDILPTGTPNPTLRPRVRRGRTRAPTRPNRHPRIASIHPLPVPAILPGAPFPFPVHPDPTDDSGTT